MPSRQHRIDVGGRVADRSPLCASRFVACAAADAEPERELAMPGYRDRSGRRLALGIDQAY